MRVYECERCKAVNRIARLRLNKQPICGACGHDIDDFRCSRRIRLIWKQRGWIFFAACIVALAVTARGLDRFVSQPRSGGVMNTSDAGKSQSATLQASPKTVAEPFTASPQPRPVVQRDSILSEKSDPVDHRERVAPLTIITPNEGGGYYVKVNYAGSKQTYLRVFINPGSSFKTTVALGQYDILVQTGERWIGRKRGRRPFWPTVFSGKLNSSFSFYETADGFMGNTITLIKKADGNLSEMPISDDQFGD